MKWMEMYWWSKVFVPVFLILYLFSSCVSSEDDITFETDLISISEVLNTIFRNGIEDSVLTVNKTLVVNQKNEEMQLLKGYNILKDLKMLEDYEVATPRWADFYKIESRDSSGVETLHYTTNNTGAPASRIDILKEGDQIRRIKVRGEKKTFISRQSSEIDWDIHRGYRIINQSKLLFQNPRTFEIKVSYNKQI